MTAVVGLLNKRGIAIAADSAVTITRDRKVKIENSANKMLRMSDVNPISIMIVGSAAFHYTPWDIIVRRYRQKRGHQLFPTVQACIDDFFSYMLTEKIFFPEDAQKNFLQNLLDSFWDNVVCQVPDIEINQKEAVTNKRQILSAYRKRIYSGIKYFKTLAVLPSFKDYTIDQFKDYMGSMVDDLFQTKTINLDCPFFDKDDIPSNEYTKEIFSEIKDLFIEGFFSYVIYGYERANTQLIFSGYGHDEEYPVMIRAQVSHGFDNRISYIIHPKDVHAISDTNPVAICPYAQVDIMEALLTGIDPDLYYNVLYKSEKMFSEIAEQISSDYMMDDDSEEIDTILKRVKCSDLIRQFKQYGNGIRETERRQWLKALRNYSVQDMAHLAENLIAMTSFERHMTFSPEGVGGPIDLAVITKNDGFVWLNRKSWYHHKDVGGRYGKFGV